MKFKTYNLDCRDVMDMYLADNSVDSIVTDPPYELSNDGKQSPNRVFFEFAFPQNPKIEAHRSGSDCLANLIGEVLSLRAVGAVPRPASPVPVVSVALDDYFSVGENDVKDTSERPVGIAQVGARSDIETEDGKYLGCFSLKLTDPAKIFQVLNECGTGFYSGAVGVGFGVGTPCLPSFECCGTSIYNCYEDVGLAHSALSNLIGAFTGTASGPVLGFQLGRASEEHLTADGARMFASILLLSGSQLIRTNPAASGLSSVIESRRICVIDDCANRAFSFDLLVHTQSIATSGFMGKDWDGSKIAYDISVWQAALRVLKPGGHLLAFSGSRTYHRMVCAIEDAGFEIRDQIMWVYGSGFPKSLDVSKAIDKAAGVEREVVGVAGKSGSARSCMAGDFAGGEYMTTAANTDAAKQWQGWGTALKPSHEPIVVARKPLIGTVATNVLTHGTGALNIDGCRVEGESTQRVNTAANSYMSGAIGTTQEHGHAYSTGSTLGRWPANLIHDGSVEVTAQFPQTTSGARKAAHGGNGTGGVVAFRGKPNLNDFAADSGSAARFFYCAKAGKKDRDEGMGDAPVRVMAMSNQAKAELARGNMHEGDSGMNSAKLRQNNHPTVKPTDLMAYLCRLVTPPGGIVLDPFMGSGSTGKAAVREGFRFIGCELETEYHLIADARLKAAL